MSQLVDPIYYSSLVIGSLYHYTHIHRALFQRLSHQSSLYHIHQPLLTPISSPETRTAQKSTSFAFVWSRDTPNDRRQEENDIPGCFTEVINTTNGKLQDSGKPSKLCKAEMFRLYCDVYKLAMTPPTACRSPHTSHQAPPTTCQSTRQGPSIVYADAKKLSVEYQTLKSQFYDDLHKTLRLGSWVKKPFEQDQFSLPIN